MADNDTTAADAAPQDDGDKGKGDNVRASWNVSLDELHTNIAHNPPEVIELFTWCFLWCIDDQHEIRLEEFAREVHSDKTTIQRIIGGRYKHPTSGVRLPVGEKLVKAMRKFRELAQERAREARAEFVMTPTAKRIWTACDLARESRTPAFLIGPSHIGKTWALVNYAEANNHGHTIYIRLNAASGLMGMVRTIAHALGYSKKAATPALIARIKKTLKKRPNILLVFDEVHQLMYTYRKQSFFACLEVLREIYDETAVGMMLCGTELLFKSIKDNRDDLEQLLRRGVHRVILPDQPRREDVAAISEHLGLAMPERGATLTVRVGRRDITEEPFAILRQVGKEEGLKAITERLRYASKFATKEGVALSWAHFIRAHVTIAANTQNYNDWDN